MPQLAFVLCEARPREAPVQAPWEAHARFFVPDPAELDTLLTRTGLAERSLPTDLSSVVSAELLFEDGVVGGKTCVLGEELPRLGASAPPELRQHVRAWEAYMLALETRRMHTRLLIWFVS